MILPMQECCSLSLSTTFLFGGRSGDETSRRELRSVEGGSGDETSRRELRSVEGGSETSVLR